MASQADMDFSCPICLNIFSDPVVLSCSHSFCKACLQSWWADKPLRVCPVCKRKSSKTDPPCNLALKNLCETFFQELSLKEKALAKAEALCSQHSERLRLFCLDHKQLACLVCRDSKIHNNHRFRPIDEAAQENRDLVRNILKPLQEKLEHLKQIKVDWNDTAQYIKNQGQHTERQIREEFGKLRDFLQRDEQARITTLRNEEQQKSNMMQQRIEALSKVMADLSDTIRATEMRLRSDDVSFLQNYNASVQRIRQHPLQADPELPSGSLIDVAKHLGNLSFNIWDKMKEKVSYTPVILDPNSAFSGLTVSDDLRSVKLENMERITKLPKNPERFKDYSTVLGSEGFSSGTHCWEVEVDNSGNWAVGVITKSVPKQGDISKGYWEIWFRHGKYTAYSPSVIDKVLLLRQPLRRIKVHLDFNGRKLSFSDPDTNTHIFTFTHTFTETVFPFLNMTDTVQLKLLPVPVTAQV